MELLHQMRTVLKQKGFDQVPQLSSSRMLDVNDQFEIVPEGYNGTRRAILIGINYVGKWSQTELKLRGCLDACDLERN